MPDGIYPLFAGLPPRSVSMERQRRNLEQFLTDNAAEFARMPYEPWTVAARGGGHKPIETVVKGSSMLPGLLGVFPAVDIPASDHTRFVLWYPGLLVTDELYEKFHKQYYCPTGLALPALKYKDESGNEVKMVIIGDPTSPGAQINDGQVIPDGYGQFFASDARRTACTKSDLNELYCSCA